MEAQKHPAVRVGAFTVLALPDEGAQQDTTRRLLATGYHAQSTAHFIICRRAGSDRIFLLHRLGQGDIDANLLRLLNEELSPLGIVASARDYGALLFAILASPFPAPRDQRAIWRCFCLNTLSHLHHLMASPPSSLSPLAAHSHIAAFAAIYRRVGELVVGQSVLDVGSSFGFLPVLLAERIPERRLVGCDHNPDLLPIATDLAQVRGIPQVTFRCCDVLAADFSALEPFETVTAIHLVEHLTEEQMRIALAHLLEVTTHRLVIAVPFEEPVQVLYGHQQAFTLEKLYHWGNWCVARLGGTSTCWCEEVMGGLLIIDRRGGQ